MTDAAEIIGVCTACRDHLTEADWREHTKNCGSHLAYGWDWIANPHNTPWLPGYRFGVSQGSKNAKGGNRHIRTRTYSVYFRVDREGILEWTGGVKPTESTWERVREWYARGRPGSNYG